MMVTAQLVMFVWRMEPMSWREEWKCATMTCGAQCVTIPIIHQIMQISFVDNLDSLTAVTNQVVIAA